MKKEIKKEIKKVINKMNVPAPIKNGFTLYSKEKCPYCVKADKLLEKITFKMEDVNIKKVMCDKWLDDPEKKERFLSKINQWAEKEWKTFPMIFYNGTFLGGYNDFKQIYS
jgi:glutaredoxin